MQTIQYNETIPVAGSYDVIVAGGGVAGVAAALAASRAGKKALLLEKSVNLGGLATTGLINFYVPMCDGNGHKVITGMCEEFLKLSIQYGYDTLDPAWKNGEPGDASHGRYMTKYSHSIFALTLTELLLDEGVDLLLDSVVSAPVMREHHCDGLIVDGKSGRQFFEAGMVIDATGDADILYRAGVPTVQGKNYFTYVGLAIDVNHCRRAAETGNIADAYYQVSGGNASLYGDHQLEGERFYEGTSNRDVTEYIVRNQRLLLDSIKGDPRFSRDIAMLPYMPQLRTTRRLAGEFTLTTDDMGRSFGDSVGAICDFDNAGKLYEVPLRCLARSDFDNLLTCGRSVSAAGYAWDVTRVIPPAIITGQAAGLAAVHALSENRAAANVEIGALQKALSKSDVPVHISEELRKANGL